LLGVDIASGICRVVKRPHVSNRATLHYLLWSFMLKIGTWDGAWPLGKSRWLLVWKGRESNVESWHLQGTCEQVFHVLIACWSYGPSKPSSMPSTDVWLSPLLLWLCGGEKLSGDSRISQPACRGCCHEPSFSRAMTLSNAVDDYVNGCYT
jgi:hypothetical protein